MGWLRAIATPLEDREATLIDALPGAPHHAAWGHGPGSVLWQRHHTRSSHVRGALGYRYRPERGVSGDCPATAGPVR